MEIEIYKKIHDLQKNGWWFGHARNKLVISLLKKAVQNLEKCKILDVGCSEGAFLDYAKEYNLEPYGIDIDKNAIEFCRERGYNEKVLYGDIFDIPFENDFFDIVTLLDIVEHVDDDLKALEEVKRVTKKNGIILIIVPAYQWLWSKNDVLYHHKRRYSKRAVIKLLESVNIQIKRISYFNMFLFPVFVLAVLFTKLKKKIENSNVLKPVPKPINWLLKKIMDLEILIISKFGRKLNFGSSIIIITEKVL